MFYKHFPSSFGQVTNSLMNSYAVMYTDIHI